MKTYELVISTLTGGGVWFFWSQAVRDPSPKWTIVAIVFTAICMFTIVDAGRRLVRERNFNKRISGYIVEGQQLRSGASDFSTIKDYQLAVEKWSSKVGEDIRKHKGESEMVLFLKHIDMRATLEQLEVAPEKGLIDRLLSQRLFVLKNSSMRT